MLPREFGRLAEPFQSGGMDEEELFDSALGSVPLAGRAEAS
jgi:hypothetical protein